MLTQVAWINTLIFPDVGMDIVMGQRQGGRGAGDGRWELYPVETDARLCNELKTGGDGGSGEGWVCSHRECIRCMWAGTWSGGVCIKGGGRRGDSVIGWQGY